MDDLQTQPCTADCYPGIAARISIPMPRLSQAVEVSPIINLPAPDMIQATIQATSESALPLQDTSYCPAAGLSCQ